MNKACSYIQEWKSEEFWLSNCIALSDNNLKNTILISLRHVEFPKIKSLILTHNEIESIEGLNKMRMPTL